MTTSSEKGIRILDETHYFWVWSAHGPTDQGIFYQRSFVKGMVICPLPGDLASDLEAHGFRLTAYVPGEWFSHWEKEENHSFHQYPVFSPLCASGDGSTSDKVSDIGAPLPAASAFPPDELPETLPVEWVEFFDKYSAGGRLKKAHRGS